MFSMRLFSFPSRDMSGCEVAARRNWETLLAGDGGPEDAPRFVDGGVGVKPFGGRPVLGNESLEVVGCAWLVMGKDPWGWNPSWGDGGVVGSGAKPCCADWAKGESRDVTLEVAGSAVLLGDSLGGVVILRAAREQGGGVSSCPAFGSGGGDTVSEEGRLE